jgi:hypothetical protein
LLVPEPLLAPTQGELSSTPPSAETERNSISRAYIECLRDKALGPITQKKMYTALPCQKVYSLQTSHSPFLSAPEQLVACLIDTVS